MLIQLTSFFLMLVFLRTCPAKSRLAVWVDEKQVEHIIGYSMKFFIVSDGIIPSYLRDPALEKDFLKIPAEIDTFNLTWEAGEDVYTYWFNDLRSLDSRLLYNPLLSIPTSGVIPRRRKVFQMSIPCTGEDDGVAELELGLQIFNQHGQPIRGSPMRFRLKKECLAFVSSNLCPNPCLNGGRCSQQRLCECAQGYYGVTCQHSMCDDGCENNGTCMSKDVCVCPDGFSGKRCEKALCRTPCQNGGRCIQEDICWCTSGFYGEACKYSKCEPSCWNGGVCVGVNACRCPVAYTGHLCQDRRCKPKCKNGGVCIGDNTCRCPSGFLGSLCETVQEGKDIDRARRSHDKNVQNTKKRRKNKNKKTRKGKNKKKRKRRRRRRKQSLLQKVRRFYKQRKRKQRQERRRARRLRLKNKRLLV